MPRQAVNRSREIFEDLRRMTDSDELHPAIRKALDEGAAPSQREDRLTAQIAYMAGARMLDAVVDAAVEKDSNQRLRATVLTQMLVAFCLREFDGTAKICEMPYEQMVTTYTMSVPALSLFWARYVAAQ